MTTLSKIAILISKDSHLTFEIAEIQTYFKAVNIETKLFHESESILEYIPDCVIVTSPQDGKLTPYPTYGLINKPRGEYLETPRFVRNILTYDGYLTFSPKATEMLGDLMFGTRKLGTSICKMDFFPVATGFKPLTIDESNPKLIIFEPDYKNSQFKAAIHILLAKYENLFVLTTQDPGQSRYSKRFFVATTPLEIEKILNNHAIAICLNSGDPSDETINPAVIKVIASSTITIAHHTDMLESYFGDSLFYIPNNASINALPKIIEFNLNYIIKNPEIAKQKSKEAYQCYQQIFSFDKIFPQFLDFHAATLIDKGFIPNPDPAYEKALPSVTYIIRTGGKHRHFLERTLDCLVSQQYPDLRAIFVVHARFDYINEIVEKYSSLKIKVIESIKSMRSEAIRDGMAAVETELFGLFDDDDEIFPNHVRMLVKTLQYHAKRDWRGEIGMVYSGSIHADDTHPVAEQAEFEDVKLTYKNEKRAIEHFRFYSSVGMSQHTWFMPNGWLARSKFIDEELLVDPRLNTCEDLYFELQIAQRAHFAFSAEVTAIHHFHHFGNSTVVDCQQHLPDTQRIALRNFTRTFPHDSQYDIVDKFRLVGKPGVYNPNLISYQDPIAWDKIDYPNNPFFPQRIKPIVYVTDSKDMAVTYYTKRVSLLKLLKLPVSLLRYTIKFSKLDNTRKRVFINKFKTNVREIGYISTFKKMLRLCIEGRGGIHLPEQSQSESFFKKMVVKYFYWLRLIKLTNQK